MVVTNGICGGNDVAPPSPKTLGPKSESAIFLMEIRQVGDRLNALRGESESHELYDLKNPLDVDAPAAIRSSFVKALTVTSAPSQYIAGSERVNITSGQIFNLDQYVFSPVEPTNTPRMPESLNTLLPRKVLTGLDVQFPGINEPHTMDVSKYLKNRLPSGVVDTIKKNGAEFFLVNSTPEELAAYYKARGFDRCTIFNSPSSTKFYVLSNQLTGEKKVVVSGINSQARLEHQLLQFYFSGVDVENAVTAIGKVDDVKSSSLQQLRAQLNNVKADCKILYIGSRWWVMEAIGNNENGLKGANEGEGYKMLKPETHKFGALVYDLAYLDKNKTAVAAIKMPNGELAGDVVKAFIEAGFHKVVMCGAGGRISGDAAIGEYILVKCSNYKGEDVRFREKATILDVSGSMYVNMNSKSNVTVNSPLIETKSWLKEQKDGASGSVDVETAHIFKAVNQSDREITIVPGMFVSDVVGEHPLEKKIAGNGAEKHIQDFTVSTLKQLRV